MASRPSVADVPAAPADGTIGAPQKREHAWRESEKSNSPYARPGDLSAGTGGLPAFVQEWNEDSRS